MRLVEEVQQRPNYLIAYVGELGVQG
jgi:hypothetical protein